LDTHILHTLCPWLPSSPTHDTHILDIYTFVHTHTYILHLPFVFGLDFILPIALGWLQVWTFALGSCPFTFAWTPQHSWLPHPLALLLIWTFTHCVQLGFAFAPYVALVGYPLVTLVPLDPCLDLGLGLVCGPRFGCPACPTFHSALPLAPCPSWLLGLLVGHLVFLALALPLGYQHWVLDIAVWTFPAPCSLAIPHTAVSWLVGPHIAVAPDLLPPRLVFGLALPLYSVCSWFRLYPFALVVPLVWITPGSCLAYLVPLGHLPTYLVGTLVYPLVGCPLPLVGWVTPRLPTPLPRCLADLVGLDPITPH